MTVETIPPKNVLLQADAIKSNDKNIKPIPKCAVSNAHLDSDVKQSVDHATGLLQTIVTDKVSDKILRKIPSDEYLHLLTLLDEITNGSINECI